MTNSVIGRITRNCVGRKSSSVQRASFAILRSGPDGESLGIVGESDRDNPSVGVGEDVMAPCDAVEEESLLEKDFGESGER